MLISRLIVTAVAVALVSLHVIAANAQSADAAPPAAPVGKPADGTLPPVEVQTETQAEPELAAKPKKTQTTAKAASKPKPSVQAEPSQDTPEPVSPDQASDSTQSPDDRIPRVAGVVVQGYVASGTATGSKTNTPIEEIPQSVSVVGREQIYDQGAQKADEALRYTSGVFSQPFGPDSDTNWFFLRGFQATQTGVYQDGLQQYSFAFGGFFVDSFGLERVEVLKGAASVLYGGSNPGGIVNYVSKKPTGERIRYLEAGINDAGTGYVGFDFGDGSNGNFSYRMTGRAAGGDGYSDFQEGYRGFLNPTLNWKDETTSLTLLGSYANIDETHGGGSFLPYAGTVVAAPFGRIDRDANFTEPGIDVYNREQGSVGYEFEHKLTSNVTIRQNARYGLSNVHEIAPFAFGYDFFSPTPTAPNFNLTRLNFEHDTQVASFTIDNQLEGRVSTGPIEHRILFGFDYKSFNLDQTQASAAGTSISANNPVYGAPQGPRFTYIDQEIEQEQLGFYLQDQLRFGDGYILTLNGRRDRVTTNAVDTVGAASFSGTQSELSGRAGLGYEFSNGIVPYVSAATFFNPLLGSSAVAGFFNPETGVQYEAGIKYAPKWFDGLFTMAVFDLTREGVVTGAFLQETQIGEVNSRGIELEGQANVTRDFKVIGSFTALDVAITKDANAAIIGNTPFIIPDRTASLGIDYTLRAGALAGVSFGAGVRYVGSSFADNENTLVVPSSTVFDAKIGYEFDGWGIDLNVLNLEDKLFVASCQTQLTCSYGEGRSFRLTAHVAW